MELPQRTARGITLIVAASFLTALQDVVFKWLSDQLTLGQIFTLRALITLPLFIALAAWQSSIKAVLSELSHKWLLLRSFFITLLFVAFYSAIPLVNLSVLGAGTYTAPIWVSLLTAWWLKERVGGVKLMALALGFIGVLIMLAPGTEVFSPWAALPVAGALFYAVALVTTRSRCQGLSLLGMALALQLMMLLAGIIASLIPLISDTETQLAISYPYLFAGWSPIDASGWAILGLLAVFTILIGMGVAGAYQATTPPTVATFEYSYLIFAAAWDALLFNSPPDIRAVGGMALIVVAGLLVLRRQ